MHNLTMATYIPVHIITGMDRNAPEHTGMGLHSRNVHQKLICFMQLNLLFYQNLS